MTIMLTQIIGMLVNTEQYQRQEKNVYWIGNSSAQYCSEVKDFGVAFGLKCDRLEIYFALRKAKKSYLIPEYYYNIYLIVGDNCNERTVVFYKMMADEWLIKDDIGLTNSYNTKVLEYLGGWKKYKTFDKRYNLLKCCNSVESIKYLTEYYAKRILRK